MRCIATRRKLSQPLNVKSDEELDKVEEDDEESDRSRPRRGGRGSDRCRQRAVRRRRSRPATTSRRRTRTSMEKIVERIVERPLRRRLPDTRNATTHKFDVAGHEGYITVGLYADGSPGEIFIRMAKEGSTIGGLMDTIATLVSVSLQYGVPVESLVRKFEHVRFEPSGMTRNPEIPFAKSLVDYIFRWLAMEFVGGLSRRRTPPSANRVRKARRNPPPNSSRWPRPAGGKGGNGHGPRIEEDSARPFAYSEEEMKSRAAEYSGGSAGRIEPAAGDRGRSLEPAQFRIAGGCPGVRCLRQHHCPQRHLLQMFELREFDGVQLSARPAGYMEISVACWRLWRCRPAITRFKREPAPRPSMVFSSFRNARPTRRSVVFGRCSIDDFSVQNRRFIIVVKLRPETVTDRHRVGPDAMGENVEAHSPDAEIDQFDAQLHGWLGAIAQNPMGRNLPDHQVERAIAGREGAEMLASLHHRDFRRRGETHDGRIAVRFDRNHVRLKPHRGAAGSELECRPQPRLNRAGVEPLRQTIGLERESLRFAPTEFGAERKRPGIRIDRDIHVEAPADCPVHNGLIRAFHIHGPVDSECDLLPHIVGNYRPRYCKPANQAAKPIKPALESKVIGRHFRRSTFVALGR